MANGSHHQRIYGPEIRVEDFSVHDVNSDDRRRRLRLIKAVQEKASHPRRKHRPALIMAKDYDSGRPDFMALQAQLFAECRGQASARLSVELPDGSILSVALNRPYLLLGRDRSCDIALNDDSFKPVHYFLQWIDGQLFCCDVAQRTGIAARRTTLPNGYWFGREPVSIGRYKFSIVGGELPPKPDYSPLDRSDSFNSADVNFGLHFDGVEQSNNLWPVNRPLTVIGRSAQCKLRLNHKSIAAIQGCLLRTPRGCWLIDLTKDATTGVNGHSTKLSPVDVGDEIRLGSFVVSLVTMEFQSAVRTSQVYSNTVEDPRESAVSVAAPAPVGVNRMPNRELRKPVTRLLDSPRKDMLSSILTTIDDLQSTTAPSRRSMEAISRGESPSDDNGAASSDSNSIKPRQSDQVCAVVSVGPQQPTKFSNSVPSTGHSPRRSAHPTPQPRSSPSITVLRTMESAPLVEPPPAATVATIDAQKINIAQPPSITAKIAVKPMQLLTSLPADFPSIEFAPESNEGTSSHVNDSTAVREKITRFVEQQSGELESLKSQLLALKHVFDGADDDLIPTRLRESLVLPMAEAINRHTAMQVTFTEFLKSVDR